MRSFIGLLVIILLQLSRAYAQQANPLEHRITLQMEQKSVGDILNQISALSGSKLSYNSLIIDINRVTSINVVNRPVREALTRTIGPGFEFKARGSYIIITKTDEKKSTIGGYVQNAKGEPVPNATIYDPQSLLSSTTDATGYYEMRIERTYSPQQLQIRKADYSDTLIVLAPSGNALQNVTINESKRDTTLQHLAHVIADSTKAYYYSFQKYLTSKRLESQNVKDTLYRPFQVSFLPYVGSNHRLSGNVVNDVSLNLLGGYSRGTNVMEMGAGINVDRENVHGVQVAGISNLVGGNVDGVQVAALGNLVGGDVKGAQIGGLGNINLRNVYGFQSASLLNFNAGNVFGVQTSGFMNINLALAEKDSSQLSPSIQIAGFMNIHMHELNGVQIGGFMNVLSGDMKGAQISGFMNVTSGKMKGAQIAGFMNIVSGEHKGTQISSFINYATVSTNQIGFINIADSISGVPFGFLSLVKKGYHQLELSYDDVYDYNAAFRTGVPAFYNIFNVGMQDKKINNQRQWTFGYGVGTAPRITNWLRLNVDLTANQVLSGNPSDYANLLNRLYLGAEWRIVPKISLAAGVTLNAYVYEYAAQPLLYESAGTHIIDTYDLGGNTQMKTWIGYKVALRFF